MIKDMVEEYLRGGSKLSDAIQGLSAADFQAMPVPGAWSIQQIVLHLMDSDLVASERLKRIIAEDNPTIIGYNESAFAKKLFYDQQDPNLAARIFAINRQLTYEILRRLPESAYARFGTHNERGRISLGEMVAMYIQHLEHHLRFLRSKRQMLEK